jgi:hypothetical protein
LVATLFKTQNCDRCRIKFVSRKLFKQQFNFENIARQCGTANQQIVLQVAAAFTPDYEVIEGFALEDGEQVGQDTMPGQNSGLIYKGIVVLRDGIPHFTHLDSIDNIDKFKKESTQKKFSVFQQVAAIVDGTVNTDVDLPGIHKRRFLVEISENGRREFGVVSFTGKMRFAEAVSVLNTSGSDQYEIINAVYLDMGGLSEGYFYDRSGQRFLLGDPDKDMDLYTNIIVMYRDLHSE